MQYLEKYSVYLFDYNFFLNYSYLAFKTEENLEKAYLKDERDIIGAVVFNSNLKNGINGYRPIEFTVSCIVFLQLFLKI